MTIFYTKCHLDSRVIRKLYGIAIILYAIVPVIRLTDLGIRLVDTNVLVAAFATRGLCQDVLRLVLAEHSLLVSETILDELERTLTGKLRTPARRAREVVTFVCEHGEVLAPANPAPWPRSDPDDRWIVAAALEGAADVLVTGDKNLLEASGETEFRVLTPRGFWESLRTRSD